MSAKIKRCIVIDDNGLLQQKITSKVCDREKPQIGFKDFLNMEKGLIVHNTSKLNWKRDLLGVEVPHRIINCENCQNHKMCRSCIIDPKLNCFDCEIPNSRDNFLKRITQIKLYSTEINYLKREPPDENGSICYLSVLENIVEEEERDQTQVSFGKYNKCFVEMNHDKYIKKEKYVDVVIMETEQYFSCLNATRWIYKEVFFVEHYEKNSILVKVYEFDNPDTAKIFSMIDNCAKGCHNKLNLLFKYSQTKNAWTICSENYLKILNV